MANVIWSRPRRSRWTHVRQVSPSGNKSWKALCGSNPQTWLGQREERPPAMFGPVCRDCERLLALLPSNELP